MNINSLLQTRNNSHLLKTILHKRTHTAMTSPMKFNKNVMNSYKEQQSLYERYQKENVNIITNLINMKEKHSYYSSKLNMDHMKQENNKSIGSNKENEHPILKTKPKNSYKMLNEFMKNKSTSTSQGLNNTTTVCNEIKSIQRSSSLCYSPIDETNYLKKHSDNNNNNNIIKQKSYVNIAENDCCIITHNITHNFNRTQQNSPNRNQIILKRKYKNKKIERKKSVSCIKDIPIAEIDLFTESNL